LRRLEALAALSYVAGSPHVSFFFFFEQPIVKCFETKQNKKLLQYVDEKATQRNVLLCDVHSVRTTVNYPALGGMNSLLSRLLRSGMLLIVTNAIE